jgi:hypothetical protein
MVIKPTLTNGSQPYWTKAGHLPINNASDGTGVKVNQDIIATQVTMSKMEDIFFFEGGLR